MIIIYIDGCINPITPINAVLHNTTVNLNTSAIVTVFAPGEVITFACNYVSERYVHISCQEDGLWYPDSNTIPVPCPSKLNYYSGIVATMYMWHDGA